MIDAKMARHWEFLAVREVPNQGDCAVIRYLFTCGLLTNVQAHNSTIEYSARYCYDTAKEALEALKTWDGCGDPPEDWIKEKVSDRHGPGAKTER